ncbi:MAG: hypothetical protein PHG48_04275, partial [Eubacteriales bacterium]|nr:hypothetical protein [Eubacteriales bacterium]
YFSEINASMKEQAAVCSEIKEAASAISTSLKNGYAGISDAAGNIVSGLTKSIELFDKELNERITGLQTVTLKLEGSVRSFREDTGISEAKFESGIEKTVEEALIKIDEALAKITGRLAGTAEAISETADSIPAVIKSLIKQ